MNGRRISLLLEQKGRCFLLVLREVSWERQRRGFFLTSDLYLPSKAGSKRCFESDFARLVFFRLQGQ